MSQGKKSPVGKTGLIRDNQDSIKSISFSDPKCKFLDLFARSRRSAVANRFYQAVRDRCDNSFAVITQVLCESKRKGDENGYKTVQANLGIALEFAEYVMEREQLPSEIKIKLKQQRAGIYRERYLQSQPPTEKQLRYLRALGYKKEVKSKWQAIRLIDELTKK